VVWAGQVYLCCGGLGGGGGETGGAVASQGCFYC